MNFSEEHRNELSPLLYTQRLTWTKKSANDFAWAKSVANSFDYLFTKRGKDNDTKRRLDNYKLYNGRGSDAMQMGDGVGMSSSLQEEGFDSAYTKVQHYDVISQIAHAMHGEQIARPLQPIVVDMSRYSQSERKRKQTELVQQWLTQNFIEPARQAITQQVLMQSGVQDPYMLTPEQQQEIRGQVEGQVEAMTPKDIKKYMSKEFKSVREIQASKLIANLLQELDVKFMTDYNFQNVIIDGKEIYHVGIVGGRPVLDIINPIYFDWYGGSDTMFIQDAEVARYERHLSVADVYNKYGDKLTPADLKKLDRLVNLNGDGSSLGTINNIKESNIIGSPDFDAYKKKISQINLKTTEGQKQMQEVSRDMLTYRRNISSIREADFVWRTQRRLKHITRVLEDGSTERFFVDESYKMNPLKGDIEQKDIWVNEVWRCIKIGEGADALYLDMGPIPFQYRSLDNPRNVKLPYIGAEYFRLMGNDENTSPIEKGRVWNYDINLQMAKIREMESTDLGKVLLMTLNAKPDNWSWGKFFQVVRYTKMAPLDLKKEGVDAFDAQFFKSLDLSTMQDMAGKIQYLEWLINRAAIAMSFNSARLGHTEQYSTATNNQQNLARSLSQTASIYEMHDKVVTQVLDALLHASRVAYKDNKRYFASVLDDGGLAELELDSEMLWSSELGVHIVNGGEELDNINMVKQNLMHFVQNGLGLPEAIRVMWSKSGAELYNVAEEIEEKNMKAQQQQMEQMKEAEMNQQEMEKAMVQLQAELKMVMQEKELAAKLRMADTNADTLRRANDINQNEIHDYMEKEIFVQDLTMQKFDKEMQFNKEKFKKEMELKEMELKIKEKSLNKPTKK